MRFNRWLLFFLLIFYFIFYLFRNSVVLDPDFGWHLQFGKFVLQTHSIPVKDLYSYTMPSYHFVNHEWGTDSIIASIYDSGGMVPLIIIFALISISVLGFLVKEVNKSWIALPLFLAGGAVFDLVGIRPQVITLLFFSFLMSIFWNRKHWLRMRMFIPLLFLVWANLHAGFSIGIFILGWFVIWNMIEKHAFDKKDSIILLLSILATFCNPYGYHLWVEVGRTVTDQGLHSEIQEWYPAVYYTNLAFWFYLALSFFLVARYRRRFSIKVLGLYMILFLSSMTSIRNIPLFVVVSFYPTLQAMTYLYQEAGTYLYGKERFLRGYIGFFIVCLCLFLPQVVLFAYDSIVTGDPLIGYPKGAAAYLNTHLPKGNVFASYDWGGYLIWQLPEKKVFIDGRMPSWRNPTAPSTESTYAFGDYEKLMSNEISFKDVAKKYAIDTLLVSTGDIKETHIYFLGIDVEKNSLLRPFFSPSRSFSPILAEIKKMGWREVYHDKTAVVFEKPTFKDPSTK